MLEILASGKSYEDSEGEIQDERLASFSLWRDERDYLLDWSWSASRIRRFVDAVGEPYAGALAEGGGVRYRVAEVEEVPDVLVEDRVAHIGKVIFTRDEKPVIVCGDGLVAVKRLTLDETGEDVDLSSFRFRTNFGR